MATNTKTDKAGELMRELMRVAASVLDGSIWEQTDEQILADQNVIATFDKAIIVKVKQAFDAKLTNIRVTQGDDAHKAISHFRKPREGKASKEDLLSSLIS